MVTARHQVEIQGCGQSGLRACGNAMSDRFIIGLDKVTPHLLGKLAKLRGVLVFAHSLGNILKDSGVVKEKCSSGQFAGCELGCAPVPVLRCPIIPIAQPGLDQSPFIAR